MQHVLNVKTKPDPYKTQSELIETHHYPCTSSRVRQVGGAQQAGAGLGIRLTRCVQEEDINKLVECMALNSASTSEEESEVSEASYVSHV